jgi:hypothetical protein
MPSVLKKLCVLLFAFIFASQGVAAGTDMTVPLDTFVGVRNESFRHAKLPESTAVFVLRPVLESGWYPIAAALRERRTPARLNRGRRRG